MQKTKVNYFVDLIMGISFLVTAISGLILFFFLPSGIRGGGQERFLSVTKHVWVDVHNWFGILMIIMVFLHLVLHFQWIVIMTKQIFLVEKRPIVKEKPPQAT